MTTTASQTSAMTAAQRSALTEICLNKRYLHFELSDRQLQVTYRTKSDYIVVSLINEEGHREGRLFYRDYDPIAMKPIGYLFSRLD